MSTQLNTLNKTAGYFTDLVKYFVREIDITIDLPKITDHQWQSQVNGEGEGRRL